MRFRMPPFLPPYAVLVLAIAYSATSLWIGLSRLHDIAQLAAVRAESAATMHTLDALLNAIDEIETAERGFVLTFDDAFLAPFEHGKSRVPALLADLRDRMRDDREELSAIERLVPLIAERTALSASAIEQKRSGPSAADPLSFVGRGKEASDEIRALIAVLGSREQNELARGQATFSRIVGEARRDIYVASGVIAGLVLMLFLAVRRLKAFIPSAPRLPAGKAGAQPSGSPAATQAGIDVLMRDALLRMRLAATAAAESGARTHLLELVASTEKAMREHRRETKTGDEPPREQASLAQELVTLAQRYSRPDGPTIKATIDRALRVPDDQKSLLIHRSAEWALELLSVRRLEGDVTLQLAAGKGVTFVRVAAFAEAPDAPREPTPRQRQEADVLRQGVAAVGGNFSVRDDPTGFELTVQMPGEA